MLKNYLKWPIFLVLAITVLLIFWLVQANGNQKLPDTIAPAEQVNPLSVSQSGTQTTTNVSGAVLQQAAPPTTATTSTGTNPQ